MQQFSAGFFCRIAACAALIAAIRQPAGAKILCVNPGKAGCFSTIGDAVAAVSPGAGDTIQVAHGTYKEMVVIPTSISLVGENQANTVIDATGKPWGINIDGFHHAGLSDVSVTGFTVENANFAGILASNASNVTLADNIVINNDKGLVTTGDTSHCPGLPAQFQKGEDLDCGEGIFFSGVDHSIVADNTVTVNAGGMLITDDTGPTHDNVIKENSVVRNTEADCGITLPSHSGAGVFHNTVAKNDSSYNGGPGVGIFAPGPGTKAYGNVVVYNTLRGNGLPGVTMHNHAAPGVGTVPAGAPPPIFNDNVIVGNDISANHADSEDAATAGPTGINIFSLWPITGTIIAQNAIKQEAIDIAIKVPGLESGPSQVQVHLNSFESEQIGLQNSIPTAISNAAAARVNAVLNWWGCSGGPAANGCATVSGTGVLFTPWLTNAPGQQ